MFDFRREPRTAPGQAGDHAGQEHFYPIHRHPGLREPGRVANHQLRQKNKGNPMPRQQTPWTRPSKLIRLENRLQNKTKYLKH